MAKIFPTKPGIVPCLNEDIPRILERTRDEQRSLIVESRQRQANGNPMASQWQEDTPELAGYYQNTKEEFLQIAQARKARKWPLN